MDLWVRSEIFARSTHNPQDSQSEPLERKFKEPERMPVATNRRPKGIRCSGRKIGKSAIITKLLASSASRMRSGTRQEFRFCPGEDGFLGEFSHKIVCFCGRKSRLDRFWRLSYSPAARFKCARQSGVRRTAGTRFAMPNLSLRTARWRATSYE